MKKQKLTDQEFDDLAKEASKYSKDNIGFDAKLGELEDLLRQNNHIKLSPRMLILRGMQTTNKGKPKEGITFFDEAIKLAIANNDVAMHALALRIKATNQAGSYDMIEAEINLKKAIELSYSIDHKYQAAACLNVLSAIYVQMNDFEKYLETSEEALRMLKSAGEDEVVYARAYVNTMDARIAHLLNMKVYDRALAVLDEVMNSPYYEMAGEHGHLTITLTQGQYLTETAQYVKSNKVLLPLLSKIANMPVNTEIASIHSYLAENMVALKKYKEAEYHITVAEDYHREIGKISFLSENLLCHAELYLNTQKDKKAGACLKEAETLIAASGSDYLMWQFYERYAAFFEKQNDHKKANEYLRVAKTHQAKSLQTDYDKRIYSITHRFELSEKEKQNQLLQKDIEMKKQELAMASDFLNQKVELLKELKSFMKNMRKENIQKNELMKAMDRKIDSVINVEYEQQLFIDKLETSSNDFITKLRNVYPQLSMTEAKICSLLRNNFSNKEIANLLVTSIRTIENHRYNIRKKLNITGDASIDTLLKSIS